MAAAGGTRRTGAAGRETLTQLGRYAVTGAVTTLLNSLVFVGLDTLSPAPLLACNAAGYLAAVSSGYLLHSRITFRDYGRRSLGSLVRFVLASLPGFALNSFWTWLLGIALHLPHWTVQLPIWLVTPFAIFTLNRWWVFR